VFERSDGSHRTASNSPPLGSSRFSRRETGLCGLAHFKDWPVGGEKRSPLYSELAGRNVGGLIEDRDGTVWATSNYPPPGGLCEIRAGAVHCHGTDGRFGAWAGSVYDDQEENLWMAAQGGVWRWTPKQPAFYSLPAQADGLQAIAQRRDGALLIATGNRITQLRDGKGRTCTCLRWRGISRSTIRGSASSRLKRFGFVTSSKGGI